MTAPATTAAAHGRRAASAARASVIVASLLAGLKLLTAIFSGSMAIAASFVDSLTDVFTSSVNLVAIRIGSRPADDDHRYGHGKAEGLAGMFQGSVVGFSGVFLVVECTRRLSAGTRVADEWLGLCVMAASTLASVWITWFLRRRAKETGSTALLADSAHYSSDVLMNVGVFAALAIERVVDAPWIDPVVGLLVAWLVLRSSWHVIRASVDELMDRELGEDVHQTIRRAVSEKVPEAREIRSLRTRRSGRARFVDLMIAFDRDLPFAVAHRLSERAVRAVRDVVPGADVTVHADPDPLQPEDHAGD
jgi:ferrous-iron efflux pump FieF